VTLAAKRRKNAAHGASRGFGAQVLTSPRGAKDSPSRNHCDQIEPLSYNWSVLTDEDKQRISQRLEKVETTLLTEFHKWASPAELRQRSHAAALHAVDAEVESSSDRLKNLEGH
jgi:hypothetical protein